MFTDVSWRLLCRSSQEDIATPVAKYFGASEVRRFQRPVELSRHWTVLWEMSIRFHYRVQLEALYHATLCHFEMRC